MKRLLTVVVAALLSCCAVFGGCDTAKTRNPDIGKNGSIEILYYKGGTGSEWIEALAEAFEDETLIKVNLKDDTTATEQALTLLEANRNLPDLMFILYTNWQKYVQNDWLAPMDDLYDGTFSYEVNGVTITSEYATAGTTVYTGNGETSGLTLKEIMVSDFVDYGLTAQKLGEEKHYWVMPWTAPCTGIVYNVKLLESVGYSEPPATEAELKDLCAKLTAKGIAPFSWGGTEMGYWNFPVLGWWAQYSGVETWQNFYQFESEEVFLDQGRVEALRLWQDLLVDPATGNWINSISAPMGRDHMDAQTQFIKGEAAMTPTGSWIETEIKDFLRPDFEMKMMPLPAIEGAQTDEDGNPVQVLNVEAGDFALIPKNAPNVEAAKAFLAFMNRPEWVEKFSATTGIPRPFNYKPSTLSGISDFKKSCFDLYENSVCMYRVSDSALYTYVGIREWPNYGPTSTYGNLAGANKKTPEEINQLMYDYVHKNWRTWMKSVGLE